MTVVGDGGRQDKNIVDQNIMVVGDGGEQKRRRWPWKDDSG